jgi:hypothetical protein
MDVTPSSRHQAWSACGLAPPTCTRGLGGTYGLRKQPPLSLNRHLSTRAERLINRFRRDLLSIPPRAIWAVNLINRSFSWCDWDELIWTGRRAHI